MKEAPANERTVEFDVPLRYDKIPYLLPRTSLAMGFAESEKEQRAAR